ncbi:translesion error-prone DNA polymerase V autoproteolytic subunit [Kiloniella laminariae]|uniref:Translesion error-prone DNA polymerase V autoproteolytic subunit n=1 Tax=Kiloniella laminariae TaxID=454162 RepID=A0ABT4LLU2_9PROT|nr:translesion error-prone DNA polymerase V autoproteolytic subunit [Kiloniella laminariae]MCZ4282083.1 translesion error-prone DNA polymerase V autoproteolytic subunit [Kiloniella laminariae]
MFSFISDPKKTRPLFASVSAGFPSPAADHMECALDLNDYLIERPAASFFVRVSGHSMTDAGIYDGDILVVDRSIKPAHKQIVLAVIEGDFTVKYLMEENNCWALVPAHKDYEPIKLTHRTDCQIWGTAVGVIRRLLP